MKVYFEADFTIGQTVYLKTDPDQSPRLVTGYHVRPHSITYQLAFKDADSYHYGIEISAERDVLMAVTS